MNFLTGKKLTESIYDIIYNAEKHLLILSPFIKLDEYLKNEVFKNHLNNASVHIIIGFGKNENNITKSFKREDLEYFTQFPNVTIVYIPNLHAKYYGNETQVVVTSLNLYDYSFENNIEFGAFASKSLVGASSFFKESKDSCLEILENSGYTVFVRRPRYKKRLLLLKDYVGSENELDLISDLINNGEIEHRKPSEFLDEKFVNLGLKEERIGKSENHNAKSTINNNKYTNQPKKVVENSNFFFGHCIRCQDSIKLDLEKPLCRDCFNVWSQFEDVYYSENYCIVCGEEHDSSFDKPSCYECYKQLDYKNKNVRSYF